MLNDVDNIVWPCEFACTLITENLVLPNYYTIRVSVEPTNPKVSDINLGFKKIKFFIANYLHNAILINKENPMIEILPGLDTNLVVLPVEPFDFFLVNILYLKLTAITEKYFDISYIAIESSIGDNVQYVATLGNDVELELDGDFWWNTNSVDTGTSDTTSWEELNFKDPTKFSPTVVQGGLSG
jgi:hypothetical protein